MSYYKKVLFPFIEELILSHKQGNNYDLSVNDLSLGESYEFAGHLLEHYNRDLDSFFECISDRNVMDSLIKCLKMDDMENKFNFTETIMWELVRFYKNTMQDMIDNVSQILRQNHYEEYQLRPSYHKDNGEVFWHKAYGDAI